MNHRKAFDYLGQSTALSSRPSDVANRNRQITNRNNNINNNNNNILDEERRNRYVTKQEDWYQIRLLGKTVPLHRDTY